MNIQPVDGSEIDQTDAASATNASRNSGVPSNKGSEIDQTVSSVTRSVFIVNLSIRRTGNPQHIGYGQLVDGSFCKGRQDSVYLVAQNDVFTDQREGYDLFQGAQKIAHFYAAKQPGNGLVRIPFCSIAKLPSWLRS